MYKLESQVRFNNSDTIFFIDCIVNDMALLKKQVGDSYKIVDWVHCVDLKRYYKKAA